MWLVKVEGGRFDFVEVVGVDFVNCQVMFDYIIFIEVEQVVGILEVLWVFQCFMIEVQFFVVQVCCQCYGVIGQVCDVRWFVVIGFFIVGVEVFMYVQVWVGELIIIQCWFVQQVFVILQIGVQEVDDKWVDLL